MDNIYYCKKCGRQIGLFDWEQLKCDICNSELYEVPHEYTDDFRWRDGDGKQAVIEELVKTSPEFDQYLFDHRDEILAKQNAEFNQKMAIGKAIGNGAKPEEAFKGNFSIVKCPSCGSSNISKVGIASRIVSAGVFGLASSKIGKTHKCNNCGTMW